MLFPPNALLPGELILKTKNANFVITSVEYSMEKFPHDFMLTWIGLAGKEALGGQLHVTNLRLIFRAHRANRIHGQLSIFLPEIAILENASSMLVKRLVVATQASRETFIVWGVLGVIETIRSAQQSFPADWQGVWVALQNNPGVLGDGMNYSRFMDRLVHRSTDLGGDLTDLLQDPFSAATALHLVQFHREMTQGE